MAVWRRLGPLVLAEAALLLGAGCPGDIQAFRPCDGGTSQTCGADAADVADNDAAPIDPADEGDAPRPDRIENGQVVLYTFEEGEGTIVRDRDEGQVRTDLTVADGAAVEWLPGGGLRLLEPTIMSSNEAADPVLDALVFTDELTVEAWIEPARASASGPGRIVTLAGDGESVNLLLGHGSTLPAGRDQYQARIRTSETGDEGWPGLTTPRGAAQVALTHLVLTRDEAGAQRIYVNGEALVEVTREGDFSTWDETYALSLGNDPDGGDPFLGVYRLVAIYRRALTAGEVAQNFAAGPD